MSLSSMDPAHTNTSMISIIGMGFVGLPLAMLLVHKGFHVVGIDLDHAKIENINRGISGNPDIDNSQLSGMISSGHLTASADYDGVKDANIIIICVPTPIGTDHNPDLIYLKSVGRALSFRIKKGQLIILESSSFPGTTREVLLPLLEASGLNAGRDFHLAYSPERIDPGNKIHALDQIPKLVGGLTEDCVNGVVQFYSRVFQQVVKVSSPEVAELSKLLENTYRFVNISFMNEFAQLCDRLNIDVWEVIEAADTKPYGFHAFYPGPGAGGHCIPVDPLYLQWKLNQSGFQSEFITLAHTVNGNIPAYIVDQIKMHLSRSTDLSGTSIMIYGVAYKKNTADIRESAALSVIRALLGEGASIYYHDPHVPEFTVDGHKFVSKLLTDDLLVKTDCMLILTDHSDIPIERILEYAKFVYDTRNITKNRIGKAEVIRLGGGTHSYIEH
ncbi:nucleotide sugar dehydrogenase [Cohnella suwonensis]|uniref:Nucleotide sugar dehydrogenase n=1 Tax=Cohnella suwonensis TaxID=696072 RepID=A0ABW0LW30_9BACL